MNMGIAIKEPNKDGISGPTKFAINTSGMVNTKPPNKHSFQTARPFLILLSTINVIEQTMIKGTNEPTKSVIML